MSAFTASTLELAVRVRGSRYDGMITGYINGSLKFTWADPGGMISASFIVSHQLGFRTDMVDDFSRVLIFDKCTGDCVFEGDISHPGKSTGDDGMQLEVTVEGGSERLKDWSGARIFIDRDMTAWIKTASAAVSTTVEAGEDRGGSGADALNLSFPMNQHVEFEHRAEAIYKRLVEAGQTLGWFNYAWDGGHTSGSPGWQVRAIVTPPSTVSRTQTLNVGGSGGSGAVVGGSIPVGAAWAVLQLIWTGGSSGTGTAGNDICWVSFLRVVIQPRLKLKDGTYKTGASYNDYLKASDVWQDMLGDMLASSFDGPNARLDVGTNFDIRQLAFPDGITPAGVGEELMKFEPGCTYLVKPARVGQTKYMFEWVARVAQVRYEFLEWMDNHTSGIQPVEQYDRAVARWKTPVGNIRVTVSTQSIPEMAAAGRTRTYWQDLGDISGDDDNAPQANATVLANHRYPLNAGKITVHREVTDLLTGRKVKPWEIEVGALARVVGREAYPDALNSTTPDGSTVVRIVSNSYDSNNAASDLELDSVSLSIFRAIMNSKRNNTLSPRR